MTRTRTARPLAALLLAMLALPGAASATDAASPFDASVDASAWPAIVELHDAVLELGPDDWIEAGHVVQVASPLHPHAPPLHLLSEGVLVVADGHAVTTASASWDPATGALESAALDLDLHLASVRDPAPRPPGPFPPLPGPPGRVRITCEAGEMIYNGRNIGRVERERPVPVGPFTTWCNGNRVGARWIPRVEP
jgi:hypothetical protein